MNNQVIQNTLSSNLSNSLVTGNIIIDGILAILVSTIISKIFQYIDISIFGSIYRYIMWYLYKRYTYTIELRYTKSKNFWLIDPDKRNANQLIDVLEEYLTNMKHEQQYGKIELGDIDYEKYTNLQDQKSNQELKLIPNGKIYVGDIELSYCNNKMDNKDACPSLTKIITISGKSKNDIERFMRNRIIEYSKKHYDKENKIYFYTHRYTQNNSIIFDRYVMKTQKTFNDVFFPEKKELLTLLDKFNNKQVNKFSLLLYGPPGTGKTSLIKALANYNKRSIFYVKLSEISDFHDALNIFYSEDISVSKGTYSSMGLYVPVKDRIIVLEDIDVEAKQTHNRKKEKEEKKEDTDSIDTTKQLNLADILQLLDGLYEHDEIMIVITTNDITKLDPALIRPGRITMDLLMKEMTQKCALEMINKYFPDNKLDFSIIKDGQITPAELEMMCNKYNSAKELLINLSKN